MAWRVSTTPRSVAASTNNPVSTHPANRLNTLTNPEAAARIGSNNGTDYFQFDTLLTDPAVQLFSIEGHNFTAATLAQDSAPGGSFSATQSLTNMETYDPYTGRRVFLWAPTGSVTGNVRYYRLIPTAWDWDEVTEGVVTAGSSADASGTNSVLTHNFNLAAGNVKYRYSKLGLVIGCAGYSTVTNSASNIFGVSVNGKPAARLSSRTSSAGSPWITSSMWYFPDPEWSSSLTVAASFGGTATLKRMVVCAVAWHNDDYFYGVSSAGASPGTSVAPVITPTEVRSIAFSNVVAVGSGSFSTSGVSVISQNNVGSAFQHALGRSINTTTSTVTHTWSRGASSEMSSLMFGFHSRVPKPASLYSSLGSIGFWADAGELTRNVSYPITRTVRMDANWKREFRAGRNLFAAPVSPRVALDVTCKVKPSETAIRSQFLKIASVDRGTPALFYENAGDVGAHWVCLRSSNSSMNVDTNNIETIESSFVQV